MNRVESLVSSRQFDTATAVELLNKAERLAETRFGLVDSAMLKHHPIWLWADAKDPSEAREYHLRVLPLREKVYGQDDSAVALNLMNLIAVSDDDQYLGRARGIWEKQNKPSAGLGLCYWIQAWGEAWENRYAAAIASMRRSVEITEAACGPDDLNMLYPLTGLANCLLTEGRYWEAEPLYRRALQIAKTVLGPDHPVAWSYYNNLGALFSEVGRYREAEILLQKGASLSELSLSQDNPRIGKSHFALASVYKAQKKRNSFRTQIDLVLDNCEKSHYADKILWGGALNELADSYGEEGRVAVAESLYERSITILESSGYKDIGLSYAGFAKFCFREGRYSDADSLYHKALAVQEQFDPMDPDLAEILEGMSGLHQKLGRAEVSFQEAMRSFGIRQNNFAFGAAAMSEKDALRFSKALRKSTNVLLRWYLHAGQVDGKFEREVAEIVLSNKGIVTDRSIEMHRSMIQQDRTFSALVDSFRFVQKSISRLYASPRRLDMNFDEEMDSLSTLSNDLEARLSARTDEDDAVPDRNVSLEEIAQKLPEGSSLVEYVFYEPPDPQIDSARYVAVVLERSASVHMIDLGVAASIDSIIQRYRRHFLSLPGSGGTLTPEKQVEYAEIATDLYRRIWIPLERLVAGEKLLLIVPDAALNIVSFASLTDTTGKFLIESYQFHYLSTGKDLIRLGKRKSEAQGLFALGDADYDAPARERLSHEAGGPTRRDSTDRYTATSVRSGCGDLGSSTVVRLPGTRREIDDVVSSWPGGGPVRELLGAAASEENIKREIGGFGTAHLATHGYYLNGSCGSEIEASVVDPLLLSGLFLAGANLHGRGMERINEDGFLSALEVAGLDMHGTGLVVLSACESGLGRIEQGEGVFGLRRAFLLAGARTVVSSLWQVPDKETADFMRLLYSQEAKSFPELMQRLAISQIKTARLRHRPLHPYTWGAFVATGDWRRN